MGLKKKMFRCWTETRVIASFSSQIMNFFSSSDILVVAAYGGFTIVMLLIAIAVLALRKRDGDSHHGTQVK